MTTYAHLPSTAHRWAGGRCTVSPTLAARYPETESPAAANGTRLHALAARVLQGARETMSTEDGDTLRPYLDDVARAVRDATATYSLAIERPASTRTASPLHGTPDAALLDHGAKHVTIWDLKTGWGVVEAIGNWQLACYAEMLVPPGWSCDLRIVQPGPWHPDGPVRSWVPTIAEREQFSRAIWDGLAEVTGDGTGRARVGAHCLYCPALRACAAARGVSLAVVEWAGDAVVDIPDDEVARELAVLREAAGILGLRRAALEEDVSARIRAGRRVRDAQLVEGKAGKLDWSSDDATTLSILGVMLGRDVSRRVPPTPTQAIKAGVPEAVVKSLATRAPGKLTLEIGANSRADRVFGTGETK